jgi:predicted AAA+ superfamily ATPase
MGYRRRILDDGLDELMPHLAAIAIEGAKGVGKTATASARAATVIDLTDPRQRQVLAADLDVIAHAAPPVLIDEWQLEPAVWDRARRLVDQDPTGGRLLLTGSAGPTRGVRIHSGAGRIVRLVMRPMSFCERGLVPPTVSMAALLQGGASPIAGSSPIGLAGYVDEILRSGFPGIRGLPPRVREVQLDGYLARVVDHDLQENGVLVRRPGVLKAWLSAYAAATATTASWTVILDAATPGEGDKPARQTVAGYREHLERLFILDPVPAWVPSLSPLKRLAGAPKHHLVDPALTARLVGVDSAGLLRGEGGVLTPRDGTLLGALFESLATQAVRVVAQASRADVGHLRTRNGDHEIDLIVEGSGRRVVAVEVKLSGVVTDADVRHLHWLKGVVGDRVADLVVITTGPTAFRRADGVAVIPLALLGP